MAAVFAAATIVSVEVSMRLAWPRARRDRMPRDFMSVWILPIALLQPAPHAAILGLLPAAYMRLRVFRTPSVKFAYTAATLGLTYAATALTHEAAAGHARNQPWNLDQLGGSPRAVAATIAAVLVWWCVNNALIAAVVALTAGHEAVVAFAKDREGHVVDAVAACVGVLAAALWVTNPLLVLLLVPPILLLQHHLFSGLRKAVRTDLLTDVANPAYWREVAGREVERAWASGTPLAVLMIDIDHFKAVNDRHGHLVGDELLTAVARTIAQALRPGDLVGRLGGEEFGAILTGLEFADVHRTAERVRNQVAQVRVRADDAAWVSVTASVGIARLGPTENTGGLRDLLDAADHALYAAKAAGRNCVRVASGAHRVIDLGTLRVP